jgi:glycosyltransferase involved in cell wall biosynthesis
VRFVGYDDQVFDIVDGEIWSERTFPVFMAEVGRSLDRLDLVGRLRPGHESANFRLDRVDFHPLPDYESLARPTDMVRGGRAAIKVFWRRLDDADGAWLMGPHPLALVFAALTVARRRQLVLGVRQEFRAYTRMRHPGNRLIQFAGDLLEGTWRAIGRTCGVVVVGPELARQYRRSRRLLELNVSMVREADLAPPELERAKDYDGPLTILSVGRLEEEKNPLLLADILRSLRADDPRWRLVVCGTGSYEVALAERLREYGLTEHADLRGYVPIGAGLESLYREAHAFLHVSWTEGVPQVLWEAFAARLPVVATDVGGVSGAAGAGEALLIPPGDAEAGAAALRRLGADAELRRQLTETAAASVTNHTLEAEARRVAEFLTT